MPATRKKRSRPKQQKQRSRRTTPARGESEGAHLASPTAVAAEALRTGVILKPSRQDRDDIQGEAEPMRFGDPDDSVLQNEYSGENTPGGSTPTPDQNGVDEIGRAYGLQDEDSGALRSAHEVLTRRDRRRPELTAPRRPQQP